MGWTSGRKARWKISWTARLTELLSVVHSLAGSQSFNAIIISQDDRESLRWPQTGGAVSTLDGRAAIYRNLSRPEADLMERNKSKCKVLHLRWKHHMQQGGTGWWATVPQLLDGGKQLCREGTGAPSEQVEPAVMLVKCRPTPLWSRLLWVWAARKMILPLDLSLIKQRLKY